jgi:SAM-dependent methyltransferase
MNNIYIRIKRHLQRGSLVRAVWRRVSMPFLLKPRSTPENTESYATSHLDKGPEYHMFFESRPGRRMVWSLEQDVLRSVAMEKGPFMLHLDFAGGTGRISKVLEEYTENQIVLDISKEMLDVAAENLLKATLVNRDFREGVSGLNKSSVDLVTAFRFYPNAESQLRHEAMGFISQKLRKGGWLVCNNHRNFWSLSYLFSRLLCMGGDVGMANKQFIDVAEEHGLRLVKSYSMGVIPQNEQRSFMPWKLVTPLEKFIFRLFGTKHRIGYNVIFIFERT